MEMGTGFLQAQWIVPGVILVFVLMMIFIIATVVRNYHTVPPNRVDVISGRKHKHVLGDGRGIVRGYRVVTGGGYFRIPILESVQHIDLNLITIPVEVKNAPDKNGALVTVRGVTQCKIRSDEGSLALAIERFLGYEREQIKMVSKETLEGNLRAIVGTMTIEELIQDRNALQERILKEAVADLNKMGLQVDILTLQEIEDDRSYITSLGKKRTAEVVKDATIGEAEATRDADVKSAVARREGEIAKAKADEEISEAARDRDVVKAQNEAKVAAERARIEMRAKQAAAEEQKQLNIRQIEAAQAKTEAEIDLQGAEKRRREAELEATTITQARKEGDAKVISAKAEQEAASLSGEASRIKAEKEGQGEQARQEAEAKGRKAQAEAEQKELEAKAAGKKADLLADAEGKKAILLAEAEGVLKKAEAYRQLDEAGRFLLIIEALPPVLESLGGVAREIMVPMADVIGKGLGNVKEIRMVDMGNAASRNGHGNLVRQFSNIPVETIFELGQKLQGAGLMPLVSRLASKIGLDVDSFLNRRDETEEPISNGSGDSETALVPDLAGRRIGKGAVAAHGLDGNVGEES